MAPTPVGELRPSQLLHTFGVGAMVDLPAMSALVMGLDDWPIASAEPIGEDRLLAAVRGILGDQVERMYPPPSEQEPLGSLFRGPEKPTVGVPVATFPRTLRCPSCNRLGPIARGIFDLRIDPYRPDRTGFVHTNCNRSQKGPPSILPARFVVACERGHLDDFPWFSFVHRDRRTTCQGSLELIELGVSGEAADIEIRCNACSMRRRMAEAFGDGLSSYRCSGRRPHLRDVEDTQCSAPIKVILLGASNSWFPVTLTTLHVPPAVQDALGRIVDELWNTLREVKDKSGVTLLRNLGLVRALAGFSDDQIWEVVEKRQSGSAAPAAGGDLKLPEWQVFSQPNAAPMSSDFQLSAVQAPTGFSQLIDEVVLAKRLREVSALVGFTRIASPSDLADTWQPVSQHRAPLARRPPIFVPASEVRGEGIFVRFHEPAIASWCAEQGALEGRFREAHRRWRRIRALSPEDAGFPGMRFILLHSFSHALMRQLALECGYSAASLRERIYAQEPTEPAGAMAGLLIYTAAPDSEGTLGGLVSLGGPARFGNHVRQALERMRLCASDPLCAEHAPGSGSATLHGAACHACLFAPETSCERGNRYLDRTVLVETVREDGNAFFRGGSAF